MDNNLKKSFYVSDEYRVNLLSFEPGGYTLAVLFNNSIIRLYDKVKHPESFVIEISKTNNVENWCILDG
jgi:hypothetical protein